MAAAKANYAEDIDEMVQRKADGQTYEQIAEWLNSKGRRTLRGNPLSVMTTYNIIQRAFERHEHGNKN